ncbi:MAG TPA: hypothetical protein VF173_06860 [Thermoanaerobaculia bacterium]|nr:hypothetical protein [Thermoanaerobaculia bacterium]
MSDPNRQRTWLDWTPLASLFLALLAVFIVYFTESKSTPIDRLTLVVGYVILILLFFFGLMVLFAMAKGDIDLSLLLSEAGGGASISRFQLLLFTVVIAFSLFLIIIWTKKLPDVPAGILTLLGISASTYAVSKGIQASNPDMKKGGSEKTMTVKENQAPGEAKAEVKVTEMPVNKDDGSKG